jgi:hypothetical protein
VLAYLERTDGEHARVEREEEEDRRERDRREGLERRMEALRLAMHVMHEDERNEQAAALEQAIHAIELTLEGRNDEEANRFRQRAPNLGRQAELLSLAARLLGKWGSADRQRALGSAAEEVNRQWHREQAGKEAKRRRKEDEGARAEAERVAHERELHERELHERERAEQERVHRIAEELGRAERERRRDLEERERFEREEAARVALRELEERVEALTRELQQVREEIQRLRHRGR